MKFALNPRLSRSAAHKVHVTSYSGSEKSWDAAFNDMAVRKHTEIFASTSRITLPSGQDTHQLQATLTCQQETAVGSDDH